MRKHIFTLGIILTSIYNINAMAAWPTILATDVWTDAGHNNPATLQCSDCCKKDCWLPAGGPYYDIKGTFTNACTGVPAEPACDPNRIYSAETGVCKAGACVPGTYDFFSSGLCADPSVNGETDVGYWNFGGGGDKENVTTYSITAEGQWGVTFVYGKVKGIASCNGTGGTYGVGTEANFSSVANGRNCWCKMTEPVVSKWVWDTEEGSSRDCAIICAEYCAKDTQYYSDFRSGLFESVGLK